MEIIYDDSSCKLLVKPSLMNGYWLLKISLNFRFNFGCIFEVDAALVIIK